MSESRIADFLLYDLLDTVHKMQFVFDVCVNCLNAKPTRIVATRKCQVFHLCDQCAIKFHELKKGKHNAERK